MSARAFMAGIIALVGTIASAPLAAGQPRAADGVTINADGLPQYSTFSLCATDPATGRRLHAGVDGG